MTVRLPSLIAGTALVPATFALGRRTVGREAALLGAAIVAIAPFSVVYGVEGRAYSTLALLSAVSTFLLLEALERRRWQWWAAFAALTLAVLYTHYAGVFVVAAQGAWAAWRHRDRLREIGLAYLAVGAGYAAWIPSFLVQRQDSAADRIEHAYPLGVESALRGLAKVFVGHPFFPLHEIPGRAVVAAFLAATAAAIVFALRSARRRPGGSRGVELLAVVALASPVVAILYSLGPESVFLPRNLIASLPATALLLAFVLVRAGRTVAVAGGAVVLAALAVGTARTLEDRHKRPQYSEAADYIEDRGRPGDPVLEVSIYERTPLGLSPYLDPAFPLQRVGPGDRAAVRRARARGRLFLLVPQVGVLAGTPRLPELRGFRLTTSRAFRGGGPLAVFVYSGA